MDLKNHLKTHLAKSDGTTLEKHIEDLFYQFNILTKHYPNILSEEEKEVLKLAIEYHDYGKLNKLFQHKISKNSKIKNDIIPHHFLSPLFFLSKTDKINLNLNKLVVYSIINHHARGREKYLKGGSHGINILLDEIQQNIKDIFEHLKITKLSEKTKKYYEKCLEYITDEVVNVEKLNKKIKDNDNFIKSLIKVSGFLIRIDHSASGDLTVEEEPIKEDRELLFLNYLKKQGKEEKLRPFQEKFKNKGILVLVADTGLGKTGLAFLWAKRKMFYILPNRTSTNAMFETFKKIVGEEKKERIGLLHSTSLFYIFENQENEDYSILRDYDNTKNLSKPITITTADQIFTAVFKYPTYEKIYATLSYSDVVIDEIQGFEPYQIVPMIHQIEETIKLGARYLIITATLPSIVKKELERIGFEVITNDEHTIDNTKRHKVKIEDNDILSAKYQILDNAKKGKKVLVILNTVNTAQEFFKEISKECKDVDINLLHSRFIWKDRKEKEDKIKKDYREKKGVIWISTHLVEASLDIDFDILFTEVAPADSLIQRMGRIHRHKDYDYNKPEHNVYIFTQVNEKSVSKIYEKSIREKTVELIKSHLNNEDYLLAKEKRKIVEILYSEEVLKQLSSKYLEDWKKIEKILNSNWEFLLKRESHEIFRDTITFEAIPYTFEEKVRKLIDQYYKTKEIQNKEEKRSEKLRILKEINDYKVPVPVYWIFGEEFRNKHTYEILDKDLNLVLLPKYLEYDKNLGLRVNQEILKKYNFEEDIFI